MEKQLLNLYKEIFNAKNNTPVWATHKVTLGHENELVHCPIPFVGKNYSAQDKKILLYASAENLSDYYKNGGYLDDDNFAVNRHRNFYNDSVSKNMFFPNVHIQPINDGVLLIVALYVYQKYCNNDNVTPSEFMERIAFANYCKYTIQSSEKNKDYASNAEYLKESHSYIEQDIAVLKPDIIIMPKSIYQINKKFIDSIKGSAVIIPIYQINARNVNLRIKKYPSTEYSKLNSVIAEWYDKLESNGFKGKTKENFLSVFKYINECISQIE
ncbi:MAG: hypothetical protein E7508_01340 [Ruminococcus sp.]|nr:hypothetical protein [Ruminococcus sp.]